MPQNPQVIMASNVQFGCTFKLNEKQARAIEALAGYSDDDFIKAFYAHLGSAYLKNYEEGLREFLAACRDQVRPQLHQVDDARKALGLPHG